MSTGGIINEQRDNLNQIDGGADSINDGYPKSLTINHTEANASASLYNITKKNFSRMITLIQDSQNEYDDIQLWKPEILILGDESGLKTVEKMIPSFDRFNSYIRELTGLISSLKVEFIGSQDFNNIISEPLKTIDKISNKEAMSAYNVSPS